jgi:hypothetical protein
MHEGQKPRQIIKWAPLTQGQLQNLCATIRKEAKQLDAALHPAEPESQHSFNEEGCQSNNKSIEGSSVINNSSQSQTHSQPRTSHSISSKRNSVPMIRDPLLLESMGSYITHVGTLNLVPAKLHQHLKLVLPAERVPSLTYLRTMLLQHFNLSYRCSDTS